MCRLYRSAVVAILGTALVGAASLAQQGEDLGTLAVMGRQLETGRFNLSLELHEFQERPPVELKGRAPFGAGILVWAEPSHTLLLAFWNSKQPAESTRDRLRAWSPLVEVEGDLKESQPRVTIPYEPSFDEGIVVEVVRADGDRFVLMGAKVDMRSFNVTTKVSGHSGYKSLPAKHCCSGGECGTICADCVDAYFTCDLTACTIKCGW